MSSLNSNWRPSVVWFFFFLVYCVWLILWCEYDIQRVSVGNCCFLFSCISLFALFASEILFIVFAWPSLFHSPLPSSSCLLFRWLYFIIIVCLFSCCFGRLYFTRNWRPVPTRTWRLSLASVGDTLHSQLYKKNSFFFFKWRVSSTYFVFFFFCHRCKLSVFPFYVG